MSETTATLTSATPTPTVYTDGRIAHLSSFSYHATIPTITMAALSALCVFSLLCYLGYSEFRTWRARKVGRVRDHYARQIKAAQFKNQGYIWLVNLFCADLVQSLGWALSAYNLAHDRLWPGFACDVQGFFINVGDVGSSIWALVIAVHTVLLLAGTHRTRAWAAEASTTGRGRWFIVAGIWGFVVCLGLCGPVIIQQVQPWNGPFFNSAGGGWCWIGQNYYLERIFFHYFFVFVDMAALTILYIFVFCYIQIQLKKFRDLTGTASGTDHGTTQHDLDNFDFDLEAMSPPAQVPASNQIMTTRIVHVTTEDRVRPPRTPTVATPWSKSSRSLRPNVTNNPQLLARKRMLQVARTLLWYPLVYLIITAPLTVARIAGFAGRDWASTCIFVGAAFYASGGWLNVALYTATRKGIIGGSWKMSWPLVKSLFTFKRRQEPGPKQRIPSPPSTAHSQKISPHIREKYGIPPAYGQPVPYSQAYPVVERQAPTPINAYARDDNSSDFHYDGVDFTHSTGFNSVNDSGDAKLVHDRYCIQTRMDSAMPGIGTTICTCKNIPR